MQCSCCSELSRTTPSIQTLAKPGEHRTSPSSHALCSLNPHRPDQLMLQDDPSFLPEFALPPLELLADLDARLNLDVSRSGDSQSLTPLGSQRSQSSSQVGALGGLVLPTSSPDHPGCFSLGGDNDAVDLGGADDNIVLEDPVFGFDDDGMLFEGPPAEKVAGTPAAQSGAAMLSDAGASAKVRREHEEGRMGGVQVSFNAVL
jgi:meiotic recombination protein REC8